MIVLVIGVCVAVVLLWRMLSVQTTRAQIEAVKLANDVVRDRVTQFTAVAGTEADARRDGKLIEYVEKLAQTAGMNDDAVRDHLFMNDGIRRELIKESWERGVRCRWLEQRDFDPLHNGHPGPEPRAERDCTAQCDDFMELLYLPPDSETCPFCGAATEISFPDEEVAGHESQSKTWRDDMDKWRRYRVLFPEDAARRDAQSIAAHEDAGRKRRAEFEQALAASKQRQKQ